ncbi:hypothetical protein GCM10020000_53260 [Streptomyces olivoverticillatus]
MWRPPTRSAGATGVFRGFPAGAFREGFSGSLGGDCMALYDHYFAYGERAGGRGGAGMAAGGSAATRAQEARRHERELREQLRAAQEEARRWEAAGEGERSVAAKLLMLTERGWRLLVDRRWPGTRSANVDMLLVGPGGVFVIDVKNWRSAPRTDGGHLVAGGQRRDGEIDKLLAMTRVAEGGPSPPWACRPWPSTR